MDQLTGISLDSAEFRGARRAGALDAIEDEQDAIVNLLMTAAGPRPTILAPAYS
jgi:hypothetical protein